MCVYVCKLRTQRQNLYLSCCRTRQAKRECIRLYILLLFMRKHNMINWKTFISLAFRLRNTSEHLAVCMRVCLCVRRVFGRFFISVVNFNASRLRLNLCANRQIPIPQTTEQMPCATHSFVVYRIYNLHAPNMGACAISLDNGTMRVPNSIPTGNIYWFFCWKSDERNSVFMGNQVNTTW